MGGGGGKKGLRDQEAGAMNDFPVNKGTFHCIVPCSLLGWAAQGAERGPMSSAEERSPAGQGALCRNNEPLPMQGRGGDTGW